MRYAQLFPNCEFEIKTFSCVLMHHMRQHPDRNDYRALTIEQYAKIVGAPAIYIKALALAEDHPTDFILDEMGLIIERPLGGKLRNKDD